MITSADCDAHIAQCRAIQIRQDISLRRAIAIIAISRAWMVLRTVVKSYEAIVTREARGKTNDGTLH